MKARVKATCISEKKGTRKHPVPEISLKENYGILGDAHAVDAHAVTADTPVSYRRRQVSLLADESVNTMRQKGVTLNAGDFAENILTEGIDLKRLPVGTHLIVGEAELEVTQIGKECHHDCEIKKLTGKCVMPTEGIFAVVIKGGKVRPGDAITIM